MKTKIFLAVVTAVLLVPRYAFAGGEGDAAGMADHAVTSEKLSAEEVGNKMCPVSGERVGEMGPIVKIGYKGKIYNLCCSGCIKKFEANSDKYVRIVEKELGNKGQ